MNWMEFISSIINSIIWPIVVLVAVLNLRKPVSQLILQLAQLRLKTFKYGDLEIGFEDKLEDVESNVNSRTEESSSIITEEDRQFDSVARDAPHLGVVLAWQELESELMKAVERLGLIDELSDRFYGRSLTTFKVNKLLVKHGYLDEKFYKSVSELQQLRNSAIHPFDNHFSITTDDAKRYRKLTKALIKEIQSLTLDDQAS
ncbi:hypothetical protein MHB67_08495 [Bacillus sp. FSL H8-0516]|uniref:hypothetical protein n=1 Tax=Bacillus sp. FSL H8-0516 TaxID=2921397 RepID=UPI000CCC9324|nr:hypothetical protein C1954_12650 [Bacillus stratosphericus]